MNLGVSQTSNLSYTLVTHFVPAVLDLLPTNVKLAQQMDSCTLLEPTLLVWRTVPKTQDCTETSLLTPVRLVARAVSTVTDPMISTVWHVPQDNSCSIVVVKQPAPQEHSQIPIPRLVLNHVNPDFTQTKIHGHVNLVPPTVELAQAHQPHVPLVQPLNFSTVDNVIFPQPAQLEHTQTPPTKFVVFVTLIVPLVLVPTKTNVQSVVTTVTLFHHNLIHACYQVNAHNLPSPILQLSCAQAAQSAVPLVTESVPINVRAVSAPTFSN